MRGDDPAGEGDVGKILAKGVEGRVGQVGDASERESALSDW